MPTPEAAAQRCQLDMGYCLEASSERGFCLRPAEYIAGGITGSYYGVCATCARMYGGGTPFAISDGATLGEAYLAFKRDALARYVGKFAAYVESPHNVIGIIGQVFGSFDAWANHLFGDVTAGLRERMSPASQEVAWLEIYLWPDEEQIAKGAAREGGRQWLPVTDVVAHARMPGQEPAEWGIDHLRMKLRARRVRDSRISNDSE